MSLAIADISSGHSGRHLENIQKHNISLPTEASARTMEKSGTDNERKKQHREMSSKPQKKDEPVGDTGDTAKKV